MQAPRNSQLLLPVDPLSPVNIGGMRQYYNPRHCVHAIIAAFHPSIIRGAGRSCLSAHVPMILKIKSGRNKDRKFAPLTPTAHMDWSLQIPS